MISYLNSTYSIYSTCGRHIQNLDESSWRTRVGQSLPSNFTVVAAEDTQQAVQEMQVVCCFSSTLNSSLSWEVLQDHASCWTFMYRITCHKIIPPMLPILRIFVNLPKASRLLLSLKFANNLSQPGCCFNLQRVGLRSFGALLWLRWLRRLCGLRFLKSSCRQTFRLNVLGCFRWWSWCDCKIYLGGIRRLATGSIGMSRKKDPRLTSCKCILAAWGR